MARITYSGLVTKINGSIGGTTFQDNHYGFTIKNKPNIVKPKTSHQRVSQQGMAIAVRSWATLSDADRLDWVNFAKNFPQFTKHNISSALTGYNVFCKINFFRLLQNKGILNSPAMVAYPPDPATIALTVAGSVLTMSISFPIGDSSFYILFFLSGPLKPTRKFFGSHTRFLFGYKTLNLIGDITSMYVAKFGKIPTVGQTILLSAQYYGKDNGQFLAAQKQFIVVGTTI